RCSFGRCRRLFFCQAEDGIRGFHVTGVQTCALPILVTLLVSKDRLAPPVGGAFPGVVRKELMMEKFVIEIEVDLESKMTPDTTEIGRASCRGRVAGSGAAR